VQARGTSWVLVDRGGVAFATEQRRPAGLPLVSAPVDAGAPALRAALDVLDTLPPAVRDQVRQLRAASREQVSMRLSKGRTVVWGSTERSDRKAAVLAVLLSRKASVYDVSAPDTPTTRK
jgi:cell division protein FtsQ